MDIKDILRENLNKIGVAQDAKRQAFFGQFKTIRDLRVEDAEGIVYWLGSEGFNSEEEAVEWLELQIPEYRSLGDVVRLYRVVGVTSMDEIKVNEPGEHYVLDEFQIHEESIGMYDWEDGLRAYIMEVDCPIGEIDVIRTLVQNMSFPNEWEISVKNKGNGVKVVNIREMG